MKKQILALAIAALSTISVQAAKNNDLQLTQSQQTCDGGLKFGSGPDKKVYTKLFEDINAVCGRTVKLCEVRTGGGLDNILMLQSKKVDVALAPIDVWNKMKDGDQNIAKLQGVIGLNNNYIHILVKTTGWTAPDDSNLSKLAFWKKNEARIIKDESFLNGLPVAVVGSASLQVYQLDQQKRLNLDIHEYANDAAAKKALQSGEVAAWILSAGFPAPVVEELTPADGLTLAAWGSESPSSLYSTAAVNYRNLQVFNRKILGAQNVLFTRPFDGDKKQQVAALQNCINANFRNLRDGDYQPSWNQVENLTPPPAVTAFKK